MNRVQELTMKEIKGVKIGRVSNIVYDKANDIILIVEENPSSMYDPYRHCFGTNAPELKELLETLKEYYIETLNEKLDVFNEIYQRMEP